MANEQNLIPNSERTPSERRENARKAGIASGEARRKKKLLSDLINNEFEKNVSVKRGEKIIELTKKEMAAIRLIRMINDPGTTDKVFLKALEFARDSIGEKPVEKVEMATIDQSVIDEVERMVFKDDDTTESN